VQSKFKLKDEDLINNPTPRVAVCLCLDISPSMGVYTQSGSTPIDELNEGVKTFYQAIQTNVRARYSVEVAIVAFSTNAIVVRDFGSILDAVPPMLQSCNTGGTSLGTGISTCLDLLDNRKQQYKDSGVDYYQPWLVLITDGAPTDETHVSIASGVADQVEKKSLTIIPIGVGNGVDSQALSAFSPKLAPLKLKGLEFDKFFQWLSASVCQVSMSRLDEEFQQDMEAARSWFDPL
jgi:uncharacterized protein YegL